MNRSVTADVLQAVLAILLILVTAYLQIRGCELDGFSVAVPIIIAFYFGHKAGVAGTRGDSAPATGPPNGAPGRAASSASAPATLSASPPADAGDAAGAPPLAPAP